MNQPGGRWGSNLLTDLFENPLDPGYELAAKRRAERGEGPVWVRGGARALRTATLMAVGFLLAVAYLQVVASEPENDRTRAGLATDVAARRAEADRLARDADRLREDVSRRRDEALAADPELARLRDLEARTGLARVKGDGASVKLADAPTAVDPVTGVEATENPGRVLDRDLQDIANALWEAGAEAIAINGQRLTATSTIRAAGAAILVDYRPVTGPYEVLAIGPDRLAERLRDSSTGKRFRRYANSYGMQFVVRERDGLTLPAGADPGLRYAHPPQPSATPSASASGGGR